jgi:hypothetical protein
MMVDAKNTHNSILECPSHVEVNDDILSQDKIARVEVLQMYQYATSRARSAYSVTG